MNMCPSYKRKVPPELCLKGQVFFIWSNQQSLQFAQYQISLLGGRIDNFLSKDITTILIEDTQLIACQYYPAEIAVRQAYAQNGIPNESFNHPGIVYNLPSTSRGFNLLASSPGVSGPIRVINFAREWGIQVLGIAYFLSYIDPIVKSIAQLIHPPKKSQNVTNLTGCFIKFECFHKKFRPCSKMFNSDPERLMPLRNASALVKPEACNVILDKPIAPKQIPFNHMDPNDKALFQTHEVKPPMKANEKKYPNKLKPKEENNYCECCRTHFSDLKLHIKSANHQKFVSNEKNYETVNNILKMLPSAQEFFQKHQKPAQTSDVIVHNGEMVNTNSATAVDFSMPLNLHVKKVESRVIHLPEMHPEIHLPLNLHVKKHDDIPIPLDLHVKHDIKLELPQLAIAETPALVFANEDITPSVCKSEIDVVGLKTDSPQDNNFVEPKAEPKDFGIPEAATALPDESLPTVADPALDKANPTQLYLKNFDSYWLDSLPCEMDDIIFDDNIFDFDDGKQKFSVIEQAECAPPVEAFPLTDMPHSPCLVSGISTDVKMQSVVNTSLMNSPVDMKDIVVKTEMANTRERYSPIIKTEQEFKNCTSPVTVTGEKKEFSGSFDVKSNVNFYDDKHNMDISPSCPNAMAMKSSEQMFSSDSSDDENGNVFISNVLNIITTNSDNEMRIDRESCEEESVSNSKSITRHKKSKLCINNKELENTDILHMSPEIDSNVTFLDKSEIACIENKDPTCSGISNITSNHDSHPTCSSSSVPICVNSELSCTSNSIASCSGVTQQMYGDSGVFTNNVDQTSTLSNAVFNVNPDETTERLIAPLQTCASNPELTEVDSGNHSCLNSTITDSITSVLPVNKKTVKSHKGGKDIISMTKDRNKMTKKDKACVSIHPSNVTSQSPLELPKRQKSLHKKPVRKLRKLQSLWSVCILPGNGVRLKFTCIHPESFVPNESTKKRIQSTLRSAYQ